MNQSILFNDDMNWCEVKKAIVFTAIYSGAIIQCQITQDYLTHKGMNSTIEPRAMMEYCSLILFDIEEDAQQAILDEELDDTGILILN